MIFFRGVTEFYYIHGLVYNIYGHYFNGYTIYNQARICSWVTLTQRLHVENIKAIYCYDIVLHRVLIGTDGERNSLAANYGPA